MGAEVLTKIGELGRRLNPFRRSPEPFLFFTSLEASTMTSFRDRGATNAEIAVNGLLVPSEVRRGLEGLVERGFVVPSKHPLGIELTRKGWIARQVLKDKNQSWRVFVVPEPDENTRKLTSEELGHALDEEINKLG